LCLTQIAPAHDIGVDHTIVEALAVVEIEYSDGTITCSACGGVVPLFVAPRPFGEARKRLTGAELRL